MGFWKHTGLAGSKRTFPVALPFTASHISLAETGMPFNRVVLGPSRGMREIFKKHSTTLLSEMPLNVATPDDAVAVADPEAKLEPPGLAPIARRTMPL